MAVMLSKMYEAFRAAGTPDALAREAAEESAGVEARLVRLEVKLTLVLAGVSALIVGVGDAASCERSSSGSGHVSDHAATTRRAVPARRDCARAGDVDGEITCEQTR